MAPGGGAGARAPALAAKEQPRAQPQRPQAQRHGALDGPPYYVHKEAELKWLEKHHPALLEEMRALARSQKNED